MPILKADDPGIWRGVGVASVALVCLLSTAVSAVSTVSTVPYCMPINKVLTVTTVYLFCSILLIFVARKPVRTWVKQNSDYQISA